MRFCDLNNYSLKIELMLLARFEACWGMKKVGCRTKTASLSVLLGRHVIIFDKGEAHDL